MRFGFTGTQRGMTAAQKAALYDLFSMPKIVMHELHHGDCIGADVQAHNIARAHSFYIVLHPPIKTIKRAFSKADEERSPADYLDRNKNIVVACETLVATPGEFEEQLRSGTWSTIRWAHRIKKRTIIIFPDATTKVSE